MTVSAGRDDLARQTHTRLVVAGALLGAVLGAVAAHLLWQQAQERGADTARLLDTRQALRLALIVLKTLRQIAGLAA